jgi:hypothetical protein
MRSTINQLIFVGGAKFFVRSFWAVLVCVGEFCWIQWSLNCERSKQFFPGQMYFRPRCRCMDWRIKVGVEMEKKQAGMIVL